MIENRQSRLIFIAHPFLIIRNTATTLKPGHADELYTFLRLSPSIVIVR